MSRMPSYARKVDKNQGDIMTALRARGATVYVLAKPVDLAVGYRGVNLLLEIKNPERMNRSRRTAHTEAQMEFFKTWRGQVASTETIEGAIELLDAIDTTLDNDHGGSHDRHQRI